MDKNKIFETAFNTIKESTEWGVECKDNTYGNWIDGVITFANNLINAMDNEGE